MYFAKKPGKKYQQSMKNVDWSKFGEDISKRMKDEEFGDPKDDDKEPAGRGG